VQLCIQDSTFGRPGVPLPPLSLPSLSFPFSFPSLPLPLYIGPLKYSQGLGEHCKFPQWGLGQSPSRNRLWCILALKLTSGGNNFNVSPENQFTNFVFFKNSMACCIVIQTLGNDWGVAPLGYAPANTQYVTSTTDLPRSNCCEDESICLRQGVAACSPCTRGTRFNLLLLGFLSH